MKRLAILGASGHGKVVADSAESSGWDKIVFFDDAWPSLKANGAWGVVGDTAELLNHLVEYEGIVVAIGNNNTRLDKHAELLSCGACMVSVVHPNSVVSKYADLGIGSVVMAGAIVNAGAKLGNCCIINTGATIDHDCLLGDSVHISPGAHLAGGVAIGACSWVGVGSNVRQLVQIGKQTVIGAGSVVVKNLPDSVTAFGNPARIVD